MKIARRQFLRLAAGAVTFRAARAQERTYVMKVTVPTLNDTTHQAAKNFAAAVERDSGGRIKAEVYPASQLGSMPRQIEGTQFGTIQVAVMSAEFFVGVDERFEVMAAPGLADSMEHAQRIAADAAVLKLMLGLGADKGLHGVGLFTYSQSSVISKTPIRHLVDIKGRKIRTLASQFQTAVFDRLGATPVVMSLGDVLPALQQGAIDGTLGGMPIYTNMHFIDVAKYVTETNQSTLFIMIEVNKKWYESLPVDLRHVIDQAGARESLAINPFAVEFFTTARKVWMNSGGELISLPRDEQASMVETLASVGDDVSQTKPVLHQAYETVKEAAKRTQLQPG
jgi:TRAP-type C4-dicarboxylate transport system substrate-binding protein